MIYVIFQNCTANSGLTILFYLATYNSNLTAP